MVKDQTERRLKKKGRQAQMGGLDTKMTVRMIRHSGIICRLQPQHIDHLNFKLITKNTVKISFLKINIQKTYF